MIMITISIMIILTNGMEVPGVALKQRLLPMVAVKQAASHLQDSCEVDDSDGHITVIVLVKLLIIVKVPQGRCQKKKRENVEILKKQGGSTRIPLPFFTVFNMGDPPKKGPKMQNKP